MRELQKRLYGSRAAVSGNEQKGHSRSRTDGPKYVRKATTVGQARTCQRWSCVALFGWSQGSCPSGGLFGPRPGPGIGLHATDSEAARRTF
jgi:hypothetical protein